MAERLKLRAEDAEDVLVLSTVLQAALVPLAESVWLPEERRFVFVAGRFLWHECLDVTLPPEQALQQVYSRCNFGVTFETVTAVKSRGIDLKDRGRILELLAVTTEDMPDDGAAGSPSLGSRIAIDLLFAGDAAIRLEVERVFVHGQDLGDPWPTRWRPNHPDTEAA